jgi:arylsulfatase A-like enzyme
MTEAMDTEMGRLLAAVNRTNTHILFLGDNGTMNQVIQPPFASNRGKGDLYEGGVHVPFIIAGPGVVNPGRTNDTLVHAVDVFATILEMAGINVASAGITNVIDSQSILPALTTTSNLTRYVYVEKFGTNTPTPDGRALRNTQFKLIKFASGTEEFYDLLADPYEKTNRLSAGLTATQQANYYSLEMRLGAYQNTSQAPTISSFTRSNNQCTATVARNTNTTFRLWRASTLSDLAWAPMTNVAVVTNGNMVSLTDTNPAGSANFYRVEVK